MKRWKCLFLVRSFQPTFETTKLENEQGTKHTEILLLHKVKMGRKFRGKLRFL